MPGDRAGGRRGPSGWRCRWPARWSRTWPPSTAPACARCSCAGPRSTPATSSRSSSRAGTPWPRCARRAPSGPGSCGPRNAAKAGTSTTNPSSTRTRRPRTSGRWSPTGPRRKQAGTLLASEGLDTSDLDERIGELDEQITDSGLRGKVLPARPRRHRSTRRRQDAAPLPRRTVNPRTVGKTYTAPDGKTFRPSLFVTLTCPSYGRVGEDGAPADPDTYDYTRAARDALHFAALFDRFIQNLRRFTGYDLQYFAAIEPQRRLAPHVHLAIRGTISRHELREVIAATYHQVWWPATQTVKYDGGHLPVWDEHTGTYLDPDTGEVLPTWDQALDAIGDQDEPRHVARFGARFDAQGVLAGSRDASRCIGYLTKYLTKHLGDCHQAATDAQADHAARLADALRYEPCSPTCANWLRYGIQPKNARPGLRPGACKGKAHRREYLGYAGRRVLVSRKWSGKTLADHRADRRTWLTSALGLPATDPARYSLGTGQARRPGPHAQRATAPARRRRPHPMANRPRPGPAQSRRGRSSGNWAGRMTSRRDQAAAVLLTVEAAAERLSTSPRFIRRLIAERRIEFVKVGRHVRISESALT